MTIYLKSGQTIDLGDVKYAWVDSTNNPYIPLKYANEDSKLLMLENFDNEELDPVTFVTDTSEFVCYAYNIVGILQEV